MSSITFTLGEVEDLARRFVLATNSGAIEGGGGGGDYLQMFAAFF